jgi:hypothetical protein
LHGRSANADTYEQRQCHSEIRLHGCVLPG